MATQATATGSPLPSWRWVTFSVGVAVGVAAGLAAVCVAVAAQRARRRATGGTGDSRLTGRGRPPDRDGPRPRHAPAPQHAPVVYPPPPEAELDEELAQSFPASDPPPYSHRVD